MSHISYDFVKKFSFTPGNAVEGIYSIFSYEFNDEKTEQSITSKQKKDRSGLKFFDLLIENDEQLDHLIEYNHYNFLLLGHQSDNLCVPDTLAQCFYDLIIDFMLIKTSNQDNNLDDKEHEKEIKRKTAENLVNSGELVSTAFPDIIGKDNLLGYPTRKRTDKEKAIAADSVTKAHNALKEDIALIFTNSPIHAQIGQIIADSLFSYNQVDVTDDDYYEHINGYEIFGRGVSFYQLISAFSLFIVANEMIAELIENGTNFSVGDLSQKIQLEEDPDTPEQVFIQSCFEKFNNLNFTEHEYTLPLARILIGDLSFNKKETHPFSLLTMFRNYGINLIDSFDLITMVDNYEGSYSVSDLSALMSGDKMILPLHMIDNKALDGKIEHILWGTHDDDFAIYRHTTFLIRELLFNAGFDPEIEDTKHSYNIKIFSKILEKTDKTFKKFTINNKKEIHTISVSTYDPSSKTARLKNEMILFQLTIYFILLYTLKKENNLENIDNSEHIAPIFDEEKLPTITINEINDIIKECLSIYRYNHQEYVGVFRSRFGASRKRYLLEMDDYLRVIEQIRLLAQFHAQNRESVPLWSTAKILGIGVKETDDA